jgi:hypothetical protein
MSYLFLLQNLGSTVLFGQKGFVKFQVGYAFPIAGSTIATNDLSQSAGTITSTAVDGSFGSGTQLEIGYEYPFSEIISCQLDALFLFGDDVKGNLQVSNINNGGSISTQNQSTRARFFEISPLIKFNIVGNRSLTPYIAIGPNVGFGTINNTSISNTSSIVGDIESQRVYTGPISIGSKAAIGIRWTKGLICFYGQLTLINLSFAPSHSEITKYIVGGVDQLNTLPIRSKQTIYSESVTFVTPNPIPNNSQPREAMKFYFPLSSVSFNVGFIIKLR